MSELRYLKNVTSLKLNSATCVGCGMCLNVCPHAVFALDGSKAVINDRNRCMECGACVVNCPVGALSVKAGVGCASAIIYGWLTGKEPSCDCGGDTDCC